MAFHPSQINTNRHQPEIVDILSRYTGLDAKLVFTPHLTPMDRGILSTIYVRSKASTKGHVLVVMLAYKIVRELARCWRGFNLTVEEGIHQLTTLCAQTVTVNNPGPAFNTVPKPSADLAKLIAAAGVTMPRALAERTAQVVTRKSLVEQRL